MQLPARPNNLAFPLAAVVFREFRSPVLANGRKAPAVTRRYARNKDEPLDVWKPHGGTSVSRVRLPPHLQRENTSSPHRTAMTGRLEAKCSGRG